MNQTSVYSFLHHLRFRRSQNSLTNRLGSFYGAYETVKPAQKRSKIKVEKFMTASNNDFHVDFIRAHFC